MVSRKSKRIGELRAEALDDPRAQQLRRRCSTRSSAGSSSRSSPKPSSSEFSSGTQSKHQP
jgi:hypothetical protein